MADATMRVVLHLPEDYADLALPEPRRTVEAANEMAELMRRFAQPGSTVEVVDDMTLNYWNASKTHRVVVGHRGGYDGERRWSCWCYFRHWRRADGTPTGTPVDELTQVEQLLVAMAVVDCGAPSERTTPASGDSRRFRFRLFLEEFVSCEGQDTLFGRSPVVTQELSASWDMVEAMGAIGRMAADPQLLYAIPFASACLDGLAGAPYASVVVPKGGDHG